MQPPDDQTPESIAAARAAQLNERAEVERTCGVMILDDDTIVIEDEIQRPSLGDA